MEVKDYIEIALNEANEKHGDKFLDHHQGSDVLREELYELECSFKGIKERFDDLWVNYIIHDKTSCREPINDLKEVSDNLVLEALQVAAMIRKLDNYYSQFENYNIKVKK